MGKYIRRDTRRGRERRRAAFNAPTWIRNGVIAKGKAKAHRNWRERLCGQFGPASECRTLTPDEIAELGRKP